MIEDMEEFKFVDKLTRAVTIDMTFFHPRMGYFVLRKLVSLSIFSFCVQFFFSLL